LNFNLHLKTATSIHRETFLLSNAFISFCLIAKQKQNESTNTCSYRHRYCE